MTPGRAAAGCLLTLVLVAAGAIAVLRPSVWEYEQAGTYQVRRNRLTDRLEIRRGDNWVKPAEPRDLNAVPTAAELSAVRVVDFAWTPHGLIAGRVKNGSGRTIAGRVTYRIVIREKNRSLVKDRSLRKWVSWPARETSDFILKTDLAAPSAGRSMTLTIEPMY